MKKLADSFQTVLSRTFLATLPLLLALSNGCATHAANPAPTAMSPASSGGITDTEIHDVLNRVARHQLHPLKDGDYKPVDSLAEARNLEPPAGIAWNYPWGVALYGVLRSTDVTGDKEAEKFVLEHNAIVARDYACLAGLQSKAANSAEWDAFRNDRDKIKIRELMNLGSLDSCGAMGAQFLEGMLRHPETVTPEHKAVAARIADWIGNKQDRLPDGTLWRAQSFSGTVWPDDLYMSCPFLIRWAKYTGDGRYLDDAASQIIHQAALEQDADGLWVHGYFVNEKRRAPFKWGRGNGWAMVAAVEVLSAMPENHPARAQVMKILRKQIEGIKPLQTTNGMWRQVLDKPELWEETSCTAMFAYSIARAVNRGWIDASNMAVARKAFAGISKNVTPDGGVNGTCEGTGIGEDLDFYIKRRQPIDDTHGRGPVLLAGTEILLAGKK